MKKYITEKVQAKQQVDFQLDVYTVYTQSWSSFQLFNKMQENYHFMDIKFRWFISYFRPESVTETEGLFILEIFSWKIWVIRKRSVGKYTLKHKYRKWVSALMESCEY